MKFNIGDRVIGNSKTIVYRGQCGTIVGFANGRSESVKVQWDNPKWISRVGILTLDSLVKPNPNEPQTDEEFLDELLDTEKPSEHKAKNFSPAKNNKIIPIVTQPTAQPVIVTLQDAMRLHLESNKPKYQGQAAQWKSEGRCPQCGELGRYSMSVAVCSKHGEY